MRWAEWPVMQDAAGQYSEGEATGAAQPQNMHRRNRGWAASETEMQGPGGPEYFTYGPIGPYTQRKTEKNTDSAAAWPGIQAMRPT